MLGNTKYMLIAAAAKKLLAAAAAIFLMPSAALALDQNPGLSINGTNVPVGEILKQIEVQTGCTFAYNKSAFDQTRRITVNVMQADLKDVLDHVFEDSGFVYVVNNKHILLFPIKELETGDRWSAFPVPPTAQAHDVLEGTTVTPATAPRQSQTMPPAELPGVKAGDAYVEVMNDAAYVVIPGHQIMTMGDMTPKAASLTYPLPVLKTPDSPKSPRLAIKTNLLFDALTTMNLGLELRVSPKWTVELTGYYNPWTWANNRTVRNVMVQPEFRYWICDPFAGHFIGIHAQWVHYNLGNLPIGPFTDSRYQGELYGVGLSYGYSWYLGRRWALEATIGVGYNYLDYRKYSKVVCGACYGWNSKNYIGVTKAGLNLSFLIK